MARWHSCNVLDLDPHGRHLWVFGAAGDNVSLLAEEAKLPNEPLPGKSITKDWQALYRPKLNVAWLPADRVFLRVVQLPAADAAEAQSMIELQLEKLSPLPVGQVVWSFELLPPLNATPGTLRTAIVVIASRNWVEEFLGELEQSGYLADRLEVPSLDELLATEIREDGVWIYPGLGPDQQSCLIAWWYGGILQNLSLMHLPVHEGPRLLREQLSQTTWAGELEGWITGPPRVHLVADSATAAALEPALREASEHPIAILDPIPQADLAARTARRVTQQDSRTNLLPAEYTTRYRQQFIDRIWMRGLGAALVIYLFATLIYFAALEVLKYQHSRVERQVLNLAGSYTNALKIKSQVQIMQDQLNLQFAALECYNAVAKLLPDGLTINGLNFQRGRFFTVFGTAPSDAQARINEFNEALRRYTMKDQPLFREVKVPTITLTPGTASLSWSFACELKRPESE